MLQNNRHIAFGAEGPGADGHREVEGDTGVGPRCDRARTIRLALLVSLALLSGACGTSYSATPSRPRQVVLRPWPSPADYGTIKTAVAVRDDAVFHQRDWRRKSFAASLALRTLLTVRIGAGTCATYVTELYGNLRDLLDAYPGEDWRPLVRLLRHQPSFGRACRQPGEHRTEISDRRGGSARASSETPPAGAPTVESGSPYGA
jgi:hypothetical protein